jgi:xylan 1,4-beta-xylosidase
VILGCQPYEGYYYNTGRETFMAPVVWKDGWPTFDLGGAEDKYTYPINAPIDSTTEWFNGNYFFRDDFTIHNLKNRCQFLRTLRSQWYNLTNNPGKLIMHVRPENYAGKVNPSFIGFHQPHLKGYAATSVKFITKSDNENAGLLPFSK